jgi:hypothetical protein
MILDDQLSRILWLNILVLLTAALVALAVVLVVRS